MRISSWNTEGRLTRFAGSGQRGSPEQIIQEIEKLNSDIVFLPEAFDGDVPIEAFAENRLKELRYSALKIAYNDSGDREFAAVVDPHMMLLSRLEVEETQELRLGDSRNILAVDVLDPATRQLIRIMCVHLDDRAEENRIAQVGDLITHINASDIPVIAMGDFNAMHSDGLPARILRNRAMLFVIDKFPHRRIQDTVRRLSDMAIGDTFRHIVGETRLVDADSKSRPTTTPKMRGQEWMPSIRMAQIDHILASPEIEVSNFAIARDGGSDHRAISVTVNMTGQNKPPVL